MDEISILGNSAGVDLEGLHTDLIGALNAFAVNLVKRFMLKNAYVFSWHLAERNVILAPTAFPVSTYVESI